MTRQALIVEALTLYLVLPLAYVYAPRQLPPLPLLWAAALYSYLVLRRDPTFPRDQLWNAHATASLLPNVLAIFLLLGGLIALATWRLAPALLFTLVRRHPLLWAAVMVLYPVLSVYPQAIVYRAFLMHRYLPLVSSLAAPTQTLLLILGSAAAFGFMHIVFRNPLAVGMTFFGGLLFAWRYQSTHSLALSSLEHALYGCLLFTVGLGQYFYIGRMRLD